MGHYGMKYSLPSRELIADEVESIAKAHALDGLVLLTNCDKITPGMLMAAGRLDIPAIVVTAGPMLSGRIRGARTSLIQGTFEAVGRYQAGKISERELVELECAACPGAGSCQGMYTANTMACLTEAMGMSLPYCGTALAVSAEKKRIAQDSGARIVELVGNNVTARKVINRNSIINAIVVDNALGGSTNTVLHIPAIAHEAGVDIKFDLFDIISKRTPHICNMDPSGPHMMEDLHWAGGIPGVMNVLKNKLKDNITVSGRRVGQIAAEGCVIDPQVIRPLAKAYHKEGGIAVLKGNLAPDGCVVKQSAVSERMMKFSGKAVIFNSEEECMKAVLARKIKPGHVVVVRYEGPKGGPGMREMYTAMKLLYGRDLALKTALITDGRFSGTNKGCFVGHVSPEAAEGGPLAIVKDGDMITIDIPERNLHLHISDSEIHVRTTEWKRPEPKFKKGYLALYAHLAESADKGAIIKNKFK
jgi:dihydroxy-acid dehydratase